MFPYLVAYDETFIYSGNNCLTSVEYQTLFQKTMKNTEVVIWSNVRE